MVTFQNISVSNFFLTSDVLFLYPKIPNNALKGSKILTFKGRGGRFQKKNFADRLRMTKNFLAVIVCSQSREKSKPATPMKIK